MIVSLPKLYFKSKQKKLISVSHGHQNKQLKIMEMSEA